MTSVILMQLKSISVILQELCKRILGYENSNSKTDYIYGGQVLGIIRQFRLRISKVREGNLMKIHKQLG